MASGIGAYFSSPQKHGNAPEDAIPQDAGVDENFAEQLPEEAEDPIQGE